MKTFNIIKKNRKYFEASSNGYKCKILIDANSDALGLGQHELEVNDISVRSKYGVDLIFSLSGSVAEQESAGICTLKTPSFNEWLVAKCHRLGGKWDPTVKAWIFSGLVATEVDALDEKYNSKMVGVELTALTSLYTDREPLTIAGFVIATATGRDSGARVAEGISLIAGKFGSGGSVKNWTTRMSEGTTIRFFIPEACIGDIDAEEFSVKIL